MAGAIFGGRPISGERQKKGNDGTRATPSCGPRAKAVGAKEIGKGKDLGRGTVNPVR